MNKTMKVLFLLRTRANYESGPAPIYMRVTIEGERFEFATQRKADPEKWDSKVGRLVKSKKEETRQPNNYLDVLQMKVFEAHRELLTIGEEITAKKVRNFLLGIETDDSKTLLEVYKQHIEEIKALLGKEYAPGTLKRFKAALSSLEAFLQHKKLADISLKDVNHKFIADYR